MTTDPDLGVQIEDIVAIALKAGRLVVAMQEQGLHQIRSKSSDIDLVTEADLASENLIREELFERFPDIGFWGEESNSRPPEEYFWLVDPIDGTTNYANGVPLFAVNIALNHGEKTILGVTLELPSQRVFWAVQGQGAYLRFPDGRQIRLAVNKTDRLDQALLSTGFPYHRGQHPDNNGREFTHFMARSRGVRCFGTVAVELAYVAAGFTAAHWEAGPQPWDVASGILLLQEAGGKITSYRGESRPLGARTIIASNGQPNLHRTLVEDIQRIRADLPEKAFEV
jgi:myo-inositol-1(or 4)-monophosphatase